MVALFYGRTPQYTMGIFNWDEWGITSAAALLLWIPFSFWLFSVQRPVRAATHSVVWAFMALGLLSGLGLGESI